MQHYKWTRTVSVDGKPYPGGTVVKESEIPAGCLRSSLRVGWLEPCDAPAKDAPAKESQKRESRTAPAEPKVDTTTRSGDASSKTETTKRGTTRSRDK